MNAVDMDWQVTGPKKGVSRFPRYDAAALGFENYWYPALLSRQLRDKPISLTLFGQKIMFFRDRGTAYALHDRCPHRGIRLSIGKQEFPGTFTCRYHGWTFDLNTGVVVAALTDGPNSSVCGKNRVKRYQLAERGGLIWIYYGEGAPPPLEDEVPSEFLRDDAVMEVRVTERPGDWRHAAENGFDEAHGKYLHRDSIFVLFRHPPAWVHSEAVPESDGWITRRTDDFAFQSEYPGLGTWPKMYPWKTTKVLSRASIKMPGVLRIHFGEWIHFEWYVPTSPGRHRYFQVAMKHTSGFDARLFRLRYWTYLRWVFHVEFNNQDARVVEMMQTPPELLFKPDLAIIGWRRLCENSRGAPITANGIAPGIGYETTDPVGMEQARHRDATVS
jgi:phenylpropionate dioxygenase-like ring-hydroxylating dioxygenase large terminal subunit